MPPLIRVRVKISKPPHPLCRSLYLVKTKRSNQKESNRLISIASQLPPLCVESLGNAPLSAGLTEDFDGIDEPVRVLEVGRIASDVLFACGCLGRADGIGVPDLTGPLTAECGVKNNVVVHEVGIDIAAAAGEGGSGLAPVARVGATGFDIGRNRCSREEEDLNCRGSPL